MKRNLIFLALGFVLLVGAAILWPIIRVRQLEEAFGEVKIGDTKDLVLKRMGTPWKDGGCVEYLAGRRCAEEFIYAHPYAPFAYDYWHIGFDSNNRTILKVRKMHLASPMMEVR
jgi:hypothetical protein